VRNEWKGTIGCNSEWIHLLLNQLMHFSNSSVVQCISINVKFSLLQNVHIDGTATLTGMYTLTNSARIEHG
jgi:hypothetical protein